MLRFVLLIAAVVLLVALLRSALRRGGDEARSARPGVRPHAAGPQPMVACAHCGIHVPRGDAVVAPSGTFCGEAHRLQYEREHGHG